MFKKHLWYFCGFTVLLAAKVSAQDSINTICIMNYTCVYFSQCQDDGNIRYPCNDRFTKVCCPPGLTVAPADFSSKQGLKKNILPQQCGIVSSTDRITGGQVANLGQFPWMALLGYKQLGLDVSQFLCGGSIITDKFILTAAHCINIDGRLKLSVIRLGELNLETETDCEQEGEEKICADRYIDISVEDAIVHDKYDSKSLENDIALVKLNRKISQFTEFIQPICLPVLNDPKYKLTPNSKLIVSGWGKTSTGNIGGASHLQYTDVRLWSYEQCNASVPTKIRPIKDSQICANGQRQQDACKGDSGGPLINSTVIDGEIRSYQVGVVSFASAQVCGNAELPSIYTKVEFYIDWIISNIT